LATWCASVPHSPPWQKLERYWLIRSLGFIRINRLSSILRKIGVYDFSVILVDLGNLYIFDLLFPILKGSMNDDFCDSGGLIDRDKFEF